VDPNVGRPLGELAERARDDSIDAAVGRQIEEPLVEDPSRTTVVGTVSRASSVS